MKRSSVLIILLCLVVLVLSACAEKTSALQPDKAPDAVIEEPTQAPEATAAPAENDDQPEQPENEKESAQPDDEKEEPDAGNDGVGRRQPGERFEGTVTIEGMEETVHYEYFENEELGFGIGCDIDNFKHVSGSDSELFVSAYDDAGKPENYLEVRFSSQDAETTAAAISEELSKEYEITRGIFDLEFAGTCIRIGASEVKGTGQTADQMQTVYVIPASDGTCRVAAAHYSFESADGFGTRFRCMVNTFVVIGK